MDATIRATSTTFWTNHLAGLFIKNRFRRNDQLVRAGLAVGAGLASEPDWRYTGTAGDFRMMLRSRDAANEESLPYMILSAPHRDAATAG